MNKSSSVEDMKAIINKSGGKAMEMAKKEIMSRFVSGDDVSLALRYFAEVTLSEALPVFPAFVSISCEAVGGKTDKTSSIGEAITLMAGAADLHDDIIDQSPVKNGKRTVLGKFGQDITVLAGDSLLVCGLSRLQKECRSISGELGDRILDLITDSILELGHAEALEVKLRTNEKATAETCMNLIELKAVVPETTMRIGALLGNGNIKSVESLGRFGKVFGVASTVVEEFMDLTDFKEFNNRFKNNYPPLPFLCALQNSKFKDKILPIRKRIASKVGFEELKDSVFSSSEVLRLKEDIRTLVHAELNRLEANNGTPANEKLRTILTSSLVLLQETIG